MHRSTKLALILPDWQVDLHDQTHIDRTLKLAKQIQPDEIIHVGDESDNTTLGRWVRESPDQYEGNLQNQLDMTSALLEKFTDACPRARRRICYSNHMERFDYAVTRRIPEFRHLRGLSIESLFRLDEIGWTYEREMFDVFGDSNIVAAHGHQFGLTSANQYMSGTKAVQKLGVSLVCGHTHRPALFTCSTGYNFAMTDRFFMNAGCSMDRSKADYIGSRSPEWSHGVGLIEFNPRIGAVPHLLVGDRFRWAGQWF